MCSSPSWYDSRVQCQTMCCWLFLELNAALHGSMVRCCVKSYAIGHFLELHAAHHGLMFGVVSSCVPLVNLELHVACHCLVDHEMLVLSRIISQPFMIRQFGGVLLAISRITCSPS